MNHSGVTVIICCHNSSALLPRTLEHLAQQRVDPHIPWEVLIVDNASTDGTASLARRLWPAESRANLRVVEEPKLGLAYARARGMAEASYEFLTFIDDDNWLNPSWVQLVYAVMRDHPEVGALGGIVEPEFETERPSWFAPVSYLYALGPAGEPSGDVTGIHMLCGAGLTVRKSALVDLDQKEFRFISVGRTGKSLGSGEDSELTYSLRLAGWRLWIDPTLRMKHFLPERRLHWDYARQLAYWSAYTTPERDALVYACKPPRNGLLLQVRYLRESWIWQTTSMLAQLFLTPSGILKRSLKLGRDGDPDVLRCEFLHGRLDGLLAARPWYNQRSSEVRRLMTGIRGDSPAGPLQVEPTL
ncbi:MAG TPA: glycosyltransferase [Terriglobales bacterium]|nr:glycosyltransferase [Terriglobales bacterium]